jgi:hypothetical protein
MDDWVYAEDTRGYDLYPRGLRTPAAQTHLTRMRHGATALGIPLDMYLAHREAGEAWCCGHQAWHPFDQFGVKKDGRLRGICRAAAVEKARESYLRKKARRAGA